MSKNDENVWDKDSKIKMSFKNKEYIGYKYVYPYRYDRDYAGANTYCIRITLETIVKFCEEFGFSVKKLKCPK